MRARFAALQADGVGVAVVDAVSNADLMLIGQALDGMKLVTAGSGIAIGLPQNWQRDGRLKEGAVADALPPASGHRAVVSGSCSTATNAQVQHFKQNGRPAFAIDPLALASGDDLVGAALAWAQPKLSDGPVLIYATAEPAAVLAVQAKLGVARAGEMVEQALSQIAVGLVKLGVRQLLVAGGETSGAVVQALGVQRMTIGVQIDPGVPWTSTASPVCLGEPLHLALKSGNFGSTDFFTKAFTVLKAQT
jgi:3-dehydrotetronate 4-kinase